MGAVGYSIMRGLFFLEGSADGVGILILQVVPFVRLLLIF